MATYIKDINSEVYLSIDYHEQEEDKETIDSPYVQHEVTISKVMYCNSLTSTDITLLIDRDLISNEDLQNEILDYLEGK